MRNHRNSIQGWLAVLVLSLSALAQGGSSRGPSTAEERERAVTIAQKLEAAPLDKNLRPDREWLLRWLIEVPDIHITLCTDVLGDFMKSKYRYSPEIVSQLTFSSAAFVIQHPDKSADKAAQHTAGVEGVLKAYVSILKSKPDAKSKPLDELVERQSQGQLADYVREASKGCK